MGWTNRVLPKPVYVSLREYKIVCDETGYLRYNTKSVFLIMVMADDDDLATFERQGKIERGRQ